MKSLFKIISKTSATPITTQAGPSHKATIILQEIGGKYENTFLCTLLGNSATGNYYPNEIVYASLRFTTHDYQNQTYQDITVQEIIKFG